MQNWEETPYTTLIQVPLEISHTRTVLSREHEAMYWLLDEKSKSVMWSEFETQSQGHWIHDEEINRTLQLELTSNSLCINASIDKFTCLVIFSLDTSKLNFNWYLYYFCTD